MTRLLALAPLLGLALGMPAQAASIQYVLEGVVDHGTWTTTGHPGYGVIEVGTPTSLTFWVDSAAVDENPDDPLAGVYPLLPAASVLWIGAIPFMLLPEGVFSADPPVLAVVNAGPGTIPRDVFSLSADVIEWPCDPPSPTCADGTGVNKLDVLIFQPDTWFDSDALPTGLSPLTGGPGARVGKISSKAVGGDVLIYFIVTSLYAVPEPSTLALVALSCALTASLRTRRR